MPVTNPANLQGSDHMIVGLRGQCRIHGWWVKNQCEHTTEYNAKIASESLANDYFCCCVFVFVCVHICILNIP